MRFGGSILLTAAAAAATLAAQPARADSIDGHWCHTNGARMELQGPAIVTPAGTRMQGTYSRHAFSYVAPPADPAAGRTIAMTLLNEVTVEVRIGDGAGEAWHRCAPPISMLRWPANQQGTGNG